MIKLNTLIAEKRGLQERLEEKNVIAENDFTHVLKVLIGSLLQFVRYLLHSIPGRWTGMHWATNKSWTTKWGEGATFEQPDWSRVSNLKASLVYPAWIG